MPARVQELPKPAADLPWNKWIRAVREALHLSEDRFAEAIGAGGRDTVSKWVAKDPQEPGFVHTRRIVTLAPPPLVLDFIGAQSASGLGLDPGRSFHVQSDPSSGGRHTMTKDADYIASRLNGIGDELTRSEAAARCADAINEVLREARHPQTLGADKRQDRAQRTK